MDISLGEKHFIRGEWGKHFMGKGTVQGREGVMGSFDWAGLLGWSQSRGGHQTLPTWERDFYRTLLFYVAYKGECQGVRVCKKLI